MSDDELRSQLREQWWDAYMAKDRERRAEVEAKIIKLNGASR